MPSYSGVWNLVSQYQAQAQGNWPVPPLTGDIGLFGGGRTSGSTSTNSIEYIQIASTGAGEDFGDLTSSYLPNKNFALSSATRALWGGGENESAPKGNQDDVQYVTISTKGNAVSFTTLSDTASQYAAGLANSTRGVVAKSNSTNVMYYFTIATTGSATDFGDLVLTADYLNQGGGSSTRGIFQISYNGGVVNAINYITIASAGDATDFGDFAQLQAGCATVSSSTRAVFAGGGDGSFNPQNTISYVTIASTGNTVDFGDLANVNQFAAGVSNSTLGIVGAGASGGGSTYITTLEKFTIATTANATSFGDLTVSRAQSGGGCSNAHGGL